MIMNEPIEKDLISAIAQTESEEVEAREIELMESHQDVQAINKGVSDDIKL